MARGFLRVGIPRHKALLYERPNLVPLEEEEIAATIAVGDEAMERKLAAIRAHETQYEFFLSLEASSTTGSCPPRSISPCVVPGAGPRGRS